jgi:hypothetical protein
MDIFTLITTHFWLVALIVTGVNAAVLHRRFHALSAGRPELAAGYRQFLIGFVAVSALLWLMMGIGIVLGGVPGVFAFSDPGAGNPFVIAWHLTLIALWIAGFVWLFFLGGGQFVVDHPGLGNVNPTKPIQVQLWYLACVAGGVVAEVMMWSGFFAGVGAALP